MIYDFKTALERAGLGTKDAITPDGRLHRFHVHGDKVGSKNGWYVLYGDGLPAGAFGSWKTGQSYKWCAKAENYLTATERQEFERRMDEARQAREIEEEVRRTEAREKAASIWGAAMLAPHDHSYLARKRVTNHGLRLHEGRLVIPMRDNAGTLHSLQFIDTDGNKRFLSGGRKKGCYFAIGTPTGTLCIAEGYATAASIHKCTGLPVAVAFDAGNLKFVALALREKFPDAKIILCADNDTHVPGNPGVAKATAAATACGGLLAIPTCAGDFNDLYTGAVR